MSSATTALPRTSTTTRNIDPAHSVAEFKVKRMMIASMKGQFAKVSGVLVRDESNPANDRVEATIEAASIHTGDEQRDAHLRSADFFHVEKFPTLHFKSMGVRVVGEGDVSLEGDLTIRDVTAKFPFRLKDQLHLRRTPGATPELRSPRAQRSTARTSA
jgi:polyisoprenoid-binding protein YceI